MSKRSLSYVLTSIIVFSALLHWTKISATIIENLDTSNLIECTFSENHHNRIMVEGEKIQKVIYPEEKIFINLDGKTGQAFLSKKVDLHDEAITISVITESSQVQDIQITFDEKSSEILIIKEPMKADNDNICQETNFSTYINELIRGLKTNEIPKGYTSDSFKSVNWTPTRAIRATLTGVLRGKDTLYVYRACNESRKHVSVPERAFAIPGTKWVYAEYKTLPPGKSTLVIVGASNE